MANRLSLDQYFLKIAMLVAERSTCKRHHIGAVAVKNKRILTTGYNGAPAGTTHCLDVGCLRDQQKIPSGTQQEICRAVHAEQNAIIQAGLHGISLEGATLYCTYTPCIICAKMIINAGIKKLVTCADYADRTFVDLFKEAGVELKKIEKPSGQINEFDRGMLYQYSLLK